MAGDPFRQLSANCAPEKVRAVSQVLRGKEASAQSHGVRKPEVNTQAKAKEGPVQAAGSERGLTQLHTAIEAQEPDEEATPI